MSYLLEQTKWLLLTGIFVGFVIAWFLYQSTPVIESTRRLQAQRRLIKKIKNDLANCEDLVRKEKAK